MFNTHSRPERSDSWASAAVEKVRIIAKSSLTIRPSRDDFTLVGFSKRETFNYKLTECQSRLEYVKILKKILYTARRRLESTSHHWRN